MLHEKTREGKAQHKSTREEISDPRQKTKKIDSEIHRIIRLSGSGGPGGIPVQKRSPHRHDKQLTVLKRVLFSFSFRGLD